MPGGEARDYNIYTFSQHDNRHKIRLPAKKTHKEYIKDMKILNQSKSANVSETLNWDNSYYNRESLKSLKLEPLQHPQAMV